MLIADGQRETPDSVTGLELAFEVGGPEVVGGEGVGWHDAGMLMGASSPAFFDQILQWNSTSEAKALRMPFH